MSSIDHLLPPVRDQGQRGTCLSLSISDGHMIVRSENQPLAADYLHFYAAKRCGQGLNDGVSVAAAVDALLADGQPAEIACPYSGLPRAATWCPPPVRELWHRQLYLNDLQALWSSLSEELEAARPVVLVLDIDDAFWAPVSGVIAHCEGDALGTHAVLAVDVQTSPRLVRVRNTWGTDWGDQGYAWLSDDYLENRFESALLFERYEK